MLPVYAGSVKDLISQKRDGLLPKIERLKNDIFDSCQVLSQHESEGAFL